MATCQLNGGEVTQATKRDLLRARKTNIVGSVSPHFLQHQEDLRGLLLFPNSDKPSQDKLDEGQCGVAVRVLN